MFKTRNDLYSKWEKVCCEQIKNNTHSHCVLFSPTFKQGASNLHRRKQTLLHHAFAKLMQTECRANLLSYAEVQPQLGKIRICKVIYTFLRKITTYIRQLCNCKVAKLLNCLIILMLCKCDLATLQVCKVVKVIVSQCVILNFANFANFASAFFLAKL